MAYSSDDDLLNEFSETELAKLSGDSSGEEVNTDRTNYARELADALIDSYLCGCYDIPFQEPIDPIIKKLSIDLTVSNIFDFSYCKTSVPSTVVWRKLNAVKLLKDIRSGLVSLQNYTQGTNAPPFILSNKTVNDRIFNEDLLNQMP